MGKPGQYYESLCGAKGDLGTLGEEYILKEEKKEKRALLNNSLC